MAPTLDELLADPPLPHRGGTLVWGLGEDALRYLDRELAPGCRTLETGAGISTMLFAQRSAEHICITPAEGEVAQLRAYAEKKGISLERVRFIIQPSQNVLPGLAARDVDLALIDGGHGFPIPAIDWFYAAATLKIGGIVLIDDVHLWTGLELKRFLAEEPAWQHVCDFERAVAFARIGSDYVREWTGQPYVVRKSRWRRRLNVPLIVLRLLLKGDFRELARRTRRYLAHR